MALGCTHEDTLFVHLDDLDNISILLDEGDDLEEEITDLFNEVSSSLRKTQPIRL